MSAFFLVPDKGRAAVAEVAGEGRYVVGRIGEAEDVVTDEVAGGGGAEAAIVVGGCNDGELLNGVPREVSCWNLLASNVIEAEAVEIGKETDGRFQHRIGLRMEEELAKYVHIQLEELRRLSWFGHWLTP